MHNKHREMQFNAYAKARKILVKDPKRLISLERLLSKKIFEFVESKSEEIAADYNEAGFLYPFWQNYPPDERGRMPIGDQFPWIEVGEHVLGPKLSRWLPRSFDVRDSGMPSGPDERYVLRSDLIADIMEFTDSC